MPAFPVLLVLPSVRWTKLSRDFIDEARNETSVNLCLHLRLLILDTSPGSRVGPGALLSEPFSQVVVKLSQDYLLRDGLVLSFQAGKKIDVMFHSDSFASSKYF